MRPTCFFCKLIVLIWLFVGSAPNAVHAVDIGIEGFSLGIITGNGTTNSFGPNITDLLLPMDQGLHSSALPSSANAHFLLDSLVLKEATFFVASDLAIGRAASNVTPRTALNAVFDVRPNEPILVDISSEMTFDLPPAQMTSSASIAIVNVDTQESVAGGQLFPPGISFDGDADSGTATLQEAGVLLEPGHLYRLGYTMNMFAFTDLIGPVGTATGFGQFMFRSVPEPGTVCILVLGVSMITKRSRR